LTGQPSLSAVFRRTVLAYGTAVGKIVLTGNSLDKNSPAILTFNSFVKAVFAALFASQRRRRPGPRIKTLFLFFIEFPLTHLVLGFAVGIVTFYPGHIAFGNGTDAAPSAAAPGKCNQAGHNQAYNYNTDHNRFFSAIFHVEISKLPNYKMVII
jgi:hypothetical protein